MSHFPPRILDLPKFDGAFDAFKLAAPGCDTLFASYPAGTAIPPHTHETDNVGVVTQGEMILTIAGQNQRYVPGQWYRVPTLVEHAARFEVDSATIEFWFKESGSPRHRPTS